MKLTFAVFGRTEFLLNPLVDIVFQQISLWQVPLSQVATFLIIKVVFGPGASKVYLVSVWYLHSLICLAELKQLWFWTQPARYALTGSNYINHFLVRSGPPLDSVRIVGYPTIRIIKLTLVWVSFFRILSKSPHFRKSNHIQKLETSAKINPSFLLAKDGFHTAWYEGRKITSLSDSIHLFSLTPCTMFTNTSKVHPTGISKTLVHNVLFLPRLQCGLSLVLEAFSANCSVRWPWHI